jgi:hypothetical protein
MSHFAFLGLEVAARTFRDARLAGDAFDDPNSRTFELADFFRIVGKQTDFCRAEFFQNLRGEIVLARIGGKTQSFVSFDGVHSAVLEFVSAEFVQQADAAAFLGKIKKYSRWSLPDFLKRQFELCAAIATQGRENIAGEALRMHTHDRRGFAFQVASDQSNRFFLRATAFEAVDREAAVARRQRRMRDHLQCGSDFLWAFALMRFSAHWETRSIAGS